MQAYVGIPHVRAHKQIEDTRTEHTREQIDLTEQKGFYSFVAKIYLLPSIKGIKLISCIR